VNLLEGIKLK